MNSDPPDSDSDNSSSASSRSQSPETAASPPAPPTLDRLIVHFTSAKRALNATSFVYRANELVTTSRSLVEEIAILNARNSYCERQAGEGVDVLVKIKDALVREADVVTSEFGRVIKRLDVAHERLERTLDELRKATVDNSLQRSTTSDEHEDEELASETDPESDAEGTAVRAKTLYSFIDPSKHEELQASLRKDIDAYYSFRGDLDHTLENFTESLQTINSLINHEEINSPSKSPLYANNIAEIPHLFSRMEDEAAAMANLLGSLVRHYDLCVSALKHTEGGGEAAKQALQQAEGVQQSGVTMEESLYLKTVPEPISDEERNEMLNVLENDSEQVEDVVSELRDRNQEQETLFSQLSDHAHECKQQDGRLRETLSMLHEMRDLHLPSHLDALKTFQASWLRIRDTILDKTDSLLSLAASNESFLAAYSQLLVEVDRRNKVQSQMRKVAEKANRDLRKLWDSDREARTRFLDEYGAFLPQGIWGRAEEDGKFWEVREVVDG